ncbi:ATP-binding cassette domain-containing protein [Falsarthrobacter nasiphocae]|uniref:ATP-binding cassette subfamily B protein n=1 Tax=Falsarthrobacter nasiphocae TaxID=189863 RepID=A0AAE4C5D4_9MICC|nr:ATP-binding cassette domain-containing protein [Falsarthrobacter nasiphocae]MDR6891383.1 ATP-binding cassette subfamily B protein [Falsarthrobacter nasiphocae]
MTWLSSIRFGWGALRAAGRTSPGRLAVILLAIALENASAIAAPLILGLGLQRALTSQDGAVVAVAAYVGAVFLASAGSYLTHALYGRIEQSVQSEWMADGLTSSLASHPEARARRETSEVSYAIDALGGCLRDALSSMALSVAPSTVRVVAGACAIAAVAGPGAVVVYGLGIVAYLWVSSPLAAVHQKRQSEFFGACLTNFGGLSNAAGMWREARLFGSAPFLAARYRTSRLPVEELGIASYRATRNLVLTQTGLVAAIVAAVLGLHLASTGTGPESLGSIVSLAGVTLAAVNPLQSVGFAMSTLAAAVAKHEESTRVLRAGAPEGSTGLTTVTRAQADPEPTRSTEPTLTPPAGESPASPAAGDVRRSTPEIAVSGLGLPGLSEGARLTAGRPIWVTGPSGSGKTTLLEQLIGLRSSGGATLTIHVPGRDAADAVGASDLTTGAGRPGAAGTPGAAVAGPAAPIAYLPQESRLLESPAAANVDFGRELPPEAATSGLDALGLASLAAGGPRGDELVGGDASVLSGGETRRVCLARTLAGSEPLVVLDEPTTGLDAAARKRAWAAIEARAATAVVLVATHDTDAPRRPGDPVVTLKPR